jgi:hypothetical protein
MQTMRPALSIEEVISESVRIDLAKAIAKRALLGDNKDQSGIVDRMNIDLIRYHTGIELSSYFEDGCDEYRVDASNMADPLFSRFWTALFEKELFELLGFAAILLGPQD